MIGAPETSFTAQAEAAAALTRLVFVALSINLREIVASAPLRGRAAEALILLTQTVVVGLVAATPGQSLVLSPNALPNAENATVGAAATV